MFLENITIIAKLHIPAKFMIIIHQWWHSCFLYKTNWEHSLLLPSTAKTPFQRWNSYLLTLICGPPVTWSSLSVMACDTFSKSMAKSWEAINSAFPVFPPVPSKTAYKFPSIYGVVCFLQGLKWRKEKMLTPVGHHTATANCSINKRL